MLGNHAGIIQSVLDFDFLAGKAMHSLSAIVGVQQKSARYFWGDTEVLIPCYPSFDVVPNEVKESANLFASAQSGRRVLEGCTSALEALHNVVGGMIFAEGVPEQHSLKLSELAKEKEVFLLGPASVGLVVSGQFKLGAIGGTTLRGIESTGLTKSGHMAVISSSGGMVNEIISMVAKHNGLVSFAAAVGGERYPATTPLEVFREAMNDDSTKAVLYFGELGALDEYEIADYLKSVGKIKPVVCYIAGIVAEHFETPPQFGHAKSMAANTLETASAKKTTLINAGAIVCDSFADFEREVSRLASAHRHGENKKVRSIDSVGARRSAAFVNRISTDKGAEVQILGRSLLDVVESNTFTSFALAMLLGREARSIELKEFFDYSMKLLIDHGPQVSGAVNTMISARAGKDLASSLASGILTIGPRFGGAINQSALNLIEAVVNNERPYDFVERNARLGTYIPGIGHKKYRADNPDPRVQALLEKFSTGGKYISFMQEVEAITLTKKSQLILNVDGVIAAVALDILAEKEGLSIAELKELAAMEFFNAIFILARSVGFTAHFMEQKRLDEGLFRLPDDYIASM